MKETNSLLNNAEVQARQARFAASASPSPSPYSSYFLYQLVAEELRKSKKIEFFVCIFVFVFGFIVDSLAEIYYQTAAENLQHRFLDWLSDYNVKRLYCL